MTAPPERNAETVTAPPERNGEKSKPRRSVVRWIDDKYYDITSIVREPRQSHHGRRVPGDYSAMMILAVLFGWKFYRSEPGDWTTPAIWAMGVILGAFAAIELVRRVPLMEVLDAVSALAGAAATKGVHLASTPVQLPAFLRKKETTTSSEIEQTVKASPVPTDGGVTE